MQKEATFQSTGGVVSDTSVTLGKHEAPQSSLARNRMIPIAIILAIGISLSLISFSSVKTGNNNKIHKNLEELATSYSRIIHYSVDLNMNVLLSVRDMFNASTEVTRKDFANFVSPVLSRLGGIQALEWIPQVLHKNRQALESKAREEGFSEFTFVERQSQGTMVPAENREVYFPVYFVEPVENNLTAVGFDLGSNAKRLEALIQARDTGKPVATSPITLVQESGNEQAFLIFVPIYKSNIEYKNVTARRAALLGFSLGVYRIGDMIEATFGKFSLPYELNYYIFDTSDEAHPKLLYHSDRSENTQQRALTNGDIRNGLHTVRDVKVGGRNWEIVFKPTAGQAGNAPDFAAIAVLLAGLMFTGLISAYIWAELRRTEKVEQLVAQQTNKLTISNQELERSNEELRQFATVASHDLQEPLRNMQAFCGLLQSECGDALDEKGKDYLSRIDGSSQRMGELIRDLLNYSRVSTGGISLSEVELNDVAELALTDLKMQIDECDASIQIADLPAIDADPGQMRQLLQNLVGNAVKYRRKDVPLSVTIDIKNGDGSADESGNQASNWFQLIVRDNGIGFDDQHAERIFGVFQRLHGRHSYVGTGVGLAICRKIVDRHGGTIEARGIPDEGATFIITLPIKQPAWEGEYNANNRY